jgi:hypothetical protein
MSVLTRREIETAIAKQSGYPLQTMCATCGWYYGQHIGDVCPICSICQAHGLEHQAKPGVDVIEHPRGEHVWVICRGGVTTFVPEIQGSELDS